MALDKNGEQFIGKESPQDNEAAALRRTKPELNDPEGSAVEAFKLGERDASEIIQVRSEVELLNDQPTQIEKNDIRNVEPIDRSGIINSIKNAALRLRYPGDEDSSKTLIRTLLPSLSVQLISFAPLLMRMVDFIRFSTGAINEINPVLQQIATVASPISVGANLLLWGGIGKYLSESRFEAKNKKLYGKLLTVNKVKTVKGSAVGQTFPETSDQYYGEMHFLGKSGEGEGDEIFKQDPVLILRQGLRDLLLLAHSCKDNAPELEGLNMFVGPYSPLVTKSLERFGFTIRKPKYNDKWIDKIFGFIPEYFNSIAYKESGIKEVDRPSMACMISRDVLVDQIPKLEKYANH